MNINSLRRYLAVALPFVGSAILLFSCEAPKPVEEAPSYETLMTEYSENLAITQTENGRKVYHFQTPLMEGYSMARDPYREFRKGIRISMFDDDEMATESATLTANYAIFYEDRKLWEVKGDVVAVNKDGRRLYTSQLYWNQATHRIYSNVDSKIVSADEVYHCEGFESDEKMKDWTYRKLKGVTYVTDTEFSDTPSAEPKNDKPARPVTPAKSEEKKDAESKSKLPMPRPSRNSLIGPKGGASEPLDIGTDDGSQRQLLDLPKR